MNLLDKNDLNVVMQRKLSLGRCNLILGGDFNARHTKWKNSLNCRNGKILSSWLDLNNTNHRVSLNFSDEPTFYRENYSSHLHIFIIRDNLNVKYPVSSPGRLAILDYPSDHRAVELVLNIGCQLVKADPIIIPNYAKTNLKLFNKHIDDGLNNVTKNHCNMTLQEIDVAIDKITNLVNTTIDEFVPKITIRNQGDIPIPDSLKHIINEKKRLRRIWQRRRYDHSAHRLRSEIKCLEKIIKDRIRIVDTDHWQNKLSEIKLDNHTFANIKKFTKNTKTNPITALKRENSQILTTDIAEKAELLLANTSKKYINKIFTSAYLNLMLLSTNI